MTVYMHGLSDEEILTLIAQHGEMAELLERGLGVCELPRDKDAAPALQWQIDAVTLLIDVVTLLFHIKGEEA